MISKIYNKKIVMFFLIFLPIVEFITSITLTYTSINITLGMIYKTLFIIYSLIYLLFFDKKERKYNLTILSILFLYCFVHFFVTIPGYTLQDIFTKLVNISRFISFPISILFFYSYNEKYNISLKTINYSALLYGFVMLVAAITSTAFATYDSIGLEKGQSGWYISGNELSNLLSIFLPISLYYFTKNNKPISYLSTIFVTFGLLIIGTKTSLVGLLVGSVSLILYSFIAYLISKDKSKKKILYKLLIYFAVIMIMIPFTPAFNFMKERYYSSVEIICNDENCETTLQNGFDKFIYNGREIDLKTQGKLYYNASMFERLFGLNDINKSLATDGQFNVIEQDFYDVLFIYGYIGLIVFFIPMFAILLKYIKSLITNFKNNVTYYQAIIGVSICLSIGISYIAGHVFLASTVGIIIAFILSKLIVKDDLNNKKNIVIYMPKLSIGGMEKSLINMLNMSNTLKEYNVTLVLGYYTDKKFIESLPKDINLRILCNSKWDKKGKVEAALSYISELFYATSIDYAYSICYSYHHKVLSVVSRLASKNSILFMHTDLVNSRTKEEIETLNRNVKFEKFKAVVCVSNASKTSFNSLYPNYQGKLVVINNYIDGKKILEDSKEKIDDINFNKDVISFINVSRHFERAKKITRIIEAAKNLKDEGYNFNIYLVGDGESSKEYNKMIKGFNLQDKVILIGRKNNPYKYIKNTNYVVISSDFEGYGIVIDEARVLNKPIITTDIADAKKIITKDIGIIVENSKDGIYYGMKEALNGNIVCSYNFDYKKFNKIIDKEFKILFDSFLEV